MSEGRKFCCSCGASNTPEIRFCTSCGARFGTIIPPAPLSIDAGPQAPVGRMPQPAAPRSLPELLRFIVTTTILNIRDTVKGVLKGMIIAFVIVLLINTLLQVTNLQQTDIAESVIAAAGLNSSPEALLFWFLIMAILAFFWSQLQSRGVRSTLGKCGSMPRWIGNSIKTTGITAFPLFMAGIAAALIVRLYLLTTITGIQFLVLMFGILYSQQESLAVLAMSLGWSDLNRLVKRSGPVIPQPGFPVMGVFGAFCGFMFVLFYADNLLIITLIVVLLVMGSVVLLYRKKRPATGPVAPAGTTMQGRKIS